MRWRSAWQGARIFSGRWCTARQNPANSVISSRSIQCWIFESCSRVLELLRKYDRQWLTWILVANSVQGGTDRPGADE